MLKRKNLLNYTHFFGPTYYEKNEKKKKKIKIFSVTKKMKKNILLYLW